MSYELLRTNYIDKRSHRVYRGCCDKIYYIYFCDGDRYGRRSLQYWIEGFKLRCLGFSFYYTGWSINVKEPNYAPWLTWKCGVKNIFHAIRNIRKEHTND